MVWPQIPREKLSPMMQHYVATKEAYPDALILYRLGDFYEVFFDDAILAAKVLEIALTGKYCGLEERAPMCGVPYHAVEAYAAKLVETGHKVVIVEQMEDPKEAVGLVKRAVTRVLTPGTITDGDQLEGKKNNFLLCLYFYQASLALCYVDLSTGEMKISEAAPGEKPLQAAINWLATIQPSEVLLLEDDQNQALCGKLKNQFAAQGIYFSQMRIDSALSVQATLLIDRYLGKGYRKKLEGHYLAAVSLAALLSYIYRFQEDQLAHLTQLDYIESGQYMHLTASCREHLELDRNLYDRGRSASLFACLDLTRTAMGGRLLHQWLEMPLLSIKEIEERYDLVAAFLEDLPLRMTLRERLGQIYDLERLLGKFAYQRGNARDLLSLSYSLSALLPIKKALLASSIALVQKEGQMLDPLAELRDLIDRAIVEEPPVLITEGGLIQKGFSTELDDLCYGSDRAKEALLLYEQEERKRTGISNLKIVFRKNAGYFIEVTKSNYDKVPEDYHRKQTMKNAERYTTDYLEAQAGKITGDEQAIRAKEYEIFQCLREEVAKAALRIQETAKRLARLDVLLSFAQSADEHDYIRPSFNQEGRIEIEAGRHPVIEQVLEGSFIANDLFIGSKENRIQIITGPNMAGKSTYMRQNALILIMAQMGSFVPAKRASLPLTDKILTRIGAKDHLAMGESTFMVEMKEMAEILREASPHSFLVLDEVGRGTSTNDGLAIACAILEYLDRHDQPKTLFATHYHELTALAQADNSLTNRKVDIREEGGALIFLRKVVEGLTDRSYGIEVAKLSGLPQEILDRAAYLLAHMDAQNENLLPDEKAVEEADAFSDYRKEAFLTQIAQIDINQVTPMEALQQLASLIQTADELKGES